MWELVHVTCLAVQTVVTFYANRSQYNFNIPSKQSILDVAEKIEI